MKNIKEILNAIKNLDDDERQILFEEILDLHKVEISITSIKSVICKHYDISPELLLSKSRRADIVLARQLIMYFSREMTTLPLNAIGSNVGGKGHATVMHGCKKIKKIMEEEQGYLLVSKLAMKVRLLK